MDMNKFAVLCILALLPSCCAQATEGKPDDSGICWRSDADRIIVWNQSTTGGFTIYPVKWMYSEPVLLTVERAMVGGVESERCCEYYNVTFEVVLKSGQGK